MFVKQRLMTPGPTAVAESTRLAMAASHPHHRSAAFAELHKEALRLLRWLWDTDDDVVVVTGSGTAGMEAGMRSALAAGDRVAVVTGGKFAERWDTIAAKIGCERVVLDVEWGRSAHPDALAERLRGEAPIDALICVASETSTGALHPVAELIRTARAHSPSLIALVDGITAVGCADLSMRRDDIDVLVSGSQKAFGLPPGAAVVGVSARAWERIESRPRDSYYLDLARERKQTSTGQSAFTPSVPLVVGFHEVLTRWEAAGRDAVLAHAAALAEATRAGAAAIGLRPFAVDVPSPALTSVDVPGGIGAGPLVAHLEAHFGVRIAGGQESLKGRIARIGHLGAVDALDILHTLAGLELSIAQLGGEVVLGAGVAAAQAVLSNATAAPATARYNP